MSRDMGTEEVTNGVDTSESKEWKPQAMSGLQDNKLNQPPKQGDASFGT